MMKGHTWQQLREGLRVLRDPKRKPRARVERSRSGRWRWVLLGQRSQQPIGWGWTLDRKTAELLVEDMLQLRRAV